MVIFSRKYSKILVGPPSQIFLNIGKNCKQKICNIHDKIVVFWIFNFCHNWHTLLTIDISTRWTISWTKSIDFFKIFSNRCKIMTHVQIMSNLMGYNFSSRNIIIKIFVDWRSMVPFVCLFCPVAGFGEFSFMNWKIKRPCRAKANFLGANIHGIFLMAL